MSTYFSLRIYTDSIVHDLSVTADSHIVMASPNGSVTIRFTNSEREDSSYKNDVVIAPGHSYSLEGPLEGASE